MKDKEKKCFVCGKVGGRLKEMKIPGLYKIFVCTGCNNNKNIKK